MPPQPLLKVRSHADISFTPERVIERPEVAAQIGQCLACWSLVETQTSRLFTLLIDVSAKGGVELYNSLESTRLKNNAIKVLSRSKLHYAFYEIIDALLAEISSHQKVRDKIAHWFWGISDQITDGLVLIDPRDILAQEAHVRDVAARGDIVTADDRRYPLDHIYVYRVRDLQADAKAFVDLAALIKKCQGLCTRRGNRLWQLRDELLNDVRLASRLNQSSSEDQ